MKTILSILFVLLSLTLVGQTYDLNECPLYSKIWKSSYVKNGNVITTKLLPKNGGNFGLNTKYVEENVDVIKIQDYLLTAFNEFRHDYKCNSIVEDTVVTKECIEYSKLIFGNYVHYDGLPSNQSECVGNIPFVILTKVTKEDGDINKLIAESCFDTFVGCPAHMALLLDNKMKDYGFGVTVMNNNIFIVIRGIKKGS